MEAIDYRTCESYELIASCKDDGSEWAKAFMQIYGDKKELISADLMLGWFANAIETADSYRAAKRTEALQRTNEIAGNND